MKFRKLARALCIGAMAVTIGGAAAMSGCAIETNHARAKITIEFNDETYELEYTLYRNMYPVTVRHFIELAKSGFYDGTIIHNYTSNDWYGGGYAYDGNTEDYGTYSTAYADGSLDEYLEANDLEANTFEDGRSSYYKLFENDTFTASVYKSSADYTYDSKGNLVLADDAEPYHTIYGEFSNNGHTVSNGQRDAEYGSLKMYYTSKVIDDDKKAETQVYVYTGKKETIVSDYKYNSATSLFALQVGSSSSLSTSSYATFGYLRGDDDEETLDDLLEAIEDYIDSCGEDNFTTSVEGVITDNKEDIANPATSVGYTLTVKPIIIKKVKITKY